MPTSTQPNTRVPHLRAPLLGAKVGSQNPGAPHLASEMWASATTNNRREAALACLLWAGIILGFFTLSSRQEYYHLPALPALALLVGGFLATADRQGAPIFAPAFGR